MATSMSPRDEFFRRVRDALGRGAPTEPVTLSRDSEPVATRAEAIRRNAESADEELLSRLMDSAARAGWKVVRVVSAEEATRHVVGLAKELEARSILHSTHPVMERLDLESALSGSGIDVGAMAIGQGDDAEREQRRGGMRRRAIEADIGVTGVDYAVAETGTCVVLARPGVSRLVSLLPPVYVAVVEGVQVLPSLDELFVLHGERLKEDDPAGYMSLISGPSRSADIEFTLVTGVHGPGEVHLVLIG